MIIYLFLLFTYFNLFEIYIYSCGHPNLIRQQYFGSQFIYMWVKTQSYELGPELDLVPLNSPMFPCVSPLSCSLTPQIFQPPSLHLLPFLIVFHQWGHNHYLPTSHIFLCSSESQGILMTLEDSLGTCPRCRIVFGSGSPMALSVLGYRSCQVHVSPPLPSLLVNILPTT